MLSKLKTNVKNILNNQKGLTLLEMLVALVIFVLASILIVTAVSSALDKPKESGVRSAFNSYKNAAEILLLETSGSIDGADVDGKFVTLNEGLDPSMQFEDDAGTYKSKSDSAYNKPYTAEILTRADASDVVVIKADGKGSVPYVLGVYYVDGETFTCTTGFGRNDQDLPSNYTNACGGELEELDE